MQEEDQTIEGYMNFLNKFSTEPNLGWLVPHLYNKDMEAEIHWLYDRSTLYNWYLKEKDEDTWENLTSEEVVDQLINRKFDLSHFEIELLRVICVQAVCAHYYIERAGELVGKDKIEAAIKAISEILNEKKEKKEEKEEKLPKLKLVKKKTNPENTSDDE
jgi:hypothetical protein